MRSRSDGAASGRRRHARRIAGALTGLVLIGSSLLGSAPQAAAADPDAVEVAKGPRRTEVLAASGAVLIARAQESGPIGFTQYSSDGGATWQPWDEGWGFTPTVAANYAAGGQAVWIHSTAPNDYVVTVVDLAALGSPAAITNWPQGADKPEAATDAQAVVGRDGYWLADLDKVSPDLRISIEDRAAPKKNTFVNAGWVLRPAGLLRTRAWSKKAGGRTAYLDIDPVAPSGGFGPLPFRISGYVPYVNLAWKTDGADGLAVIEYLRLSGTSLTWCTSEWNTATDAVKKAVCKKVGKVKKGATITASRFAPSTLTTPSLAITVNGALKLWNGKKLISVAKVKSHTLAFTGVGDPDAPLVRAERAPSGDVYAADAKGKLTHRFRYFIGRMSPVALDLTHAVLAGLDGRTAYQGWIRAADGSVAPPDDEVKLPGATKGVQVSGSRSAQLAGSKLTLRDEEAQTGTASKVSALTDASGPYTLVTQSKKTVVLGPDGKVAAKPSKKGNQIVALFGSLAVEQNSARTSILVRELTGLRGLQGLTATIPGASSGWRISKVFIWGDLVVVGTSFGSFRSSYVYSWKLRNWVTVGSSPISADNTVPVAMGDGVAAVYDTTAGLYALWRLDRDYTRGDAGTKPFEDADTAVAPAFDGVGRFIYSTGTELKVVDLSDWDEADLSGKTPARLLGVVAPATWEINSRWTLAADASRPLVDGVLNIFDASGAQVAELPVTGGADGSVRVSWNGGKLDGGGSQLPGDTPDELVPDGVYTWELEIKGDDDEYLGLVTGDAQSPSGTVKVTTAKIKSAKPKITGTPAVGKTLTAATSWTPPGLAYAYEWLAGGAPIPGAEDKTFQLTSAQLGKAITVRVTATNRRGTSVAQVSKATKKVKAGKLTLGTPTVTGTPKVGVELFTSPGAWVPADTSFSYQWFRVVGKKTIAIPGAMAPSYVPVEADRGAKLRVSVMGSAPGYSSASKTSAATAVVAAA